VKLQFLGTGSAFTAIADNFQSNMIIHSDNGTHFLVDCGSDARHSMQALGFTHRDVDGVYISHLHADHAGGLEWLGFTSHFDQSPRKPKLYVHPSLIKRLWEHVLSGGLQSLEGPHPARLSDFYEIMPITDDHFTWEGIDFQLIKTIHINNGPDIAPSYGLYFTTTKKKIFITTDTRFEPELYKLYFEQADLIFHDCDTSVQKSEVHAHFFELATLPASIKAKMWLYHYHSHSVNTFNPIEHGFQGFVQKGQSFDI